MLCRREIFSQNSIWSIDVAFWDSRSVRMWYGLTGCGTAGRSRGNKKSAPGERCARGSCVVVCTSAFVLRPARG